MKNILVLMVSVLLFASCSGEKAGDVIMSAESRILENDLRGAQNICDKLLAEKTMDSFTASELCRLAVVYMKLSETNSVDENIATATQCYRMAVMIDPDSVASFFAGIPIEEVQYEATLKSIAKSLDCPCDSIESEIPDSLYSINDSLR